MPIRWHAQGRRAAGESKAVWLFGHLPSGVPSAANVEIAVLEQLTCFTGQTVLRRRVVFLGRNLCSAVCRDAEQGKGFSHYDRRLSLGSIATRAGAWLIIPSTAPDQDRQGEQDERSSDQDSDQGLITGRKA